MLVCRLTVCAAVAAGVLLAAGCSGSGEAGGDTPKVEPPQAQGGGAPSPRVTGGMVREGWFGSADGWHARVEVKGVERQSGKSVLRLGVTPLDAGARSVPFSVSLLDPVGRKFYRANAAPTVQSVSPGTPLELTVDFPAIPRNVEKVTVITGGTAGEYTGVPVTGTGDAPSPSTSSGNPVDLYDITEGEIRDVTSSGTDVKINLRTDVLFEFDKAELSGRAKQVLDQAAQELRQRADPDERPVTIIGYTDSKGGDAYNLDLSRKRAEAVEKELRNRLGDDFEYSAQGRGEADPVAEEGGADDARARSRNRRVEIAYIVRQQTEGTTTASTAPAGGRGGTVRPAEYRARDGQTVASRFGRFGEAKRRLDVKPFYRDGAYLVAVFDLVNEGPGTTPADAAYAHRDYPGGMFTSFSVQVPGSQDVYRAVRIGQAAPNGTAPYVDPGRATFRTGINQPVRGFVYIPAPPGNPTSVIFDGGPFGKVNNVPVS